MRSDLVDSPPLLHIDALALPWPWAGWLPDLLGQPLPPLPGVDCAGCGQPRPARCCSTVPDFPNFLLGATLDEGAAVPAAGRESLLQRLREQAWGTPLGLDRPDGTFHPYLGSLLAFGRERASPCPHLLEAGGCGLWTHRPAACAAWCCCHERGAVGAAVWRHLHQLMDTLERAVALWCLLEVSPDPGPLRCLVVPEGLPGGPLPRLERRFGGAPGDAPHARRVWAGWIGREEALLRACAAAAGSLDGATALQLGGPVARAALVGLRAALLEHAGPAPPSRIEVPLLPCAPAGPGRQRVWGYSPHDPLELADAVVDCLEELEGCTPAEACAALTATLPPGEDPSALLQRLLDHHVLVAAP